MSDRLNPHTRWRIEEAYRLGIFKRGELSTCEVQHEADCPAPDGGACCCIPDLVITAPDGSIRRDVGNGEWTGIAP